MEKLHSEIVLDIFYRLPPESVVRCKLVCKSWHSLLLLLLRGHFANLNLRRHHRYHRNLEYPTLNFISLQEFRDDGGGIKNVYGEFHITEYDEVEDQLNCKVKRINFPHSCVGGWKCKTRLVGSCNGLLCLTRTYHHNNLFRHIGICNTLLNEYVRLPLSDLQFKYGYTYTASVVIGFGHSPISEEYKVVGVCYPHLVSGPGYVEVSTLGNKSSSNDAGMWRSKGTIKYSLRRWSRPVLINGSLYWLAKNGSVEQNIVSFDLEDEVFRAIPLTRYSNNKLILMSNRELKELRGCLCLTEKLSDQMDIWVLKDFMNKESWVKEFSIKWEGQPLFLERTPLCYSLCAIKKKKNGDGDEILLWCNSMRLVSYDPKTRNVGEVGGRQMLVNTEEVGGRQRLVKAESIFDWDPVLHISSLVSLRALGEDAKLCGESSKIKTKSWGK